MTKTVTTTSTPAPVTRAQKSWDHRLGWSVPPERCQIPQESRSYGGQTLNSYYIDYVSDLLVQDKTLVSPIVLEGAMVSRTNTYKNLYFVSFKVFRVLKGKIHQQLKGQLRLLFRTEPGRPRPGGSRGGLYRRSSGFVSASQVKARQKLGTSQANNQNMQKPCKKPGESQAKPGKI